MVVVSINFHFRLAGQMLNSYFWCRIQLSIGLLVLRWVIFSLLSYSFIKELYNHSPFMVTYHPMTYLFQGCAPALLRQPTQQAAGHGGNFRPSVRTYVITSVFPPFPRGSDGLRALASEGPQRPSGGLQAVAVMLKMIIFHLNSRGSLRYHHNFFYFFPVGEGRLLW